MDPSGLPKYRFIALGLEGLSKAVRKSQEVVSKIGFETPFRGWRAITRSFKLLHTLNSPHSIKEPCEHPQPTRTGLDQKSYPAKEPGCVWIDIVPTGILLRRVPFRRNEICNNSAQPLRAGIIVESFVPVLLDVVLR
jgi:hypothetical protein